jgi:ABC-type nitrate/sulfonate/bicarbonate transport system ATPase subunit
MALVGDFDRNIILNEDKNEARFNEVLEAVGLDTIYGEISQKAADELSAGQKQRLSIVRGLYHLREGSVLVMDEPFSAMDANVVKKMHELFAARGGTVSI